MEKAWAKMMDKEEVGTELVNFVSMVHRVIQKVNTPKKPSRKSAFVKKMEKEFGPGHPEKPTQPATRYLQKMKAENPDRSTEEIRKMYKLDKKNQRLGDILGKVETNDSCLRFKQT